MRFVWCNTLRDFTLPHLVRVHSRLLRALSAAS